MKAALILLYMAAAGVNYGWQPADDAADGYEYIVQVEPELLDAMRQGEAAPIESNVPPEIAPIRKVRILVGRGELPRETGAVNRTAYFAGQAGWTPDRYGPIEPAAATSGERSPPPSLPPGSKVGPPPSVFERTQTAVTETTDALRDGMEAGIQAANQEFSRGREALVDETRDASQEFGRQLQSWTNDPARELEATGNNVRTAAERTFGAAGSRLQQVTNPFATNSAPPVAAANARGAVAPPPWNDSPRTSAPLWPDRTADVRAGSVDQAAAAPQPATRAASGWTSIGTNVAAPPLIVPPLSTTARRNDARPIAASMAASDGPQFPEPPSRRESIHSPLTDPAGQSAGSGAADSWSSDWGSAPNTPQVSINRSGNSPANAHSARNSDLVTVEPLGTGQQSSDRPANRFEDVWDNAAGWGQPARSDPALPATPDQTSNAHTNVSPQNPVNDLPIASAGTNGAPPAGVPPVVNQPIARAKQGDEPPWLPLLVVSLSLMGSLSANLFLGWSYMDARQKYRTLVRKTADKFRRAAAA